MKTHGISLLPQTFCYIKKAYLGSILDWGSQQNWVESTEISLSPHAHISNLEHSTLESTVL